MSGSGPTSVVDQSGEMKRVVNWVRSAWTAIQNKRMSWRWMKAQMSEEISTADALDIVVIDRFARWVGDSFWIYETAQGEANKTPLQVLPFVYFRDMYLIGNATPTRPTHVAISPADGVLVGPEPNTTYTVVGEYYRSPQMLSANTDTPEMPERFHEAIMWRALMWAARYDSASEIWTEARNNYLEMMMALEKDQLDTPRLADVTLVA